MPLCIGQSRSPINAKESVEEFNKSVWDRPLEVALTETTRKPPIAPKL